MPDDTFHLMRFVDAQRGLYEQACAELRRGHKTGHWMWFIFPQLAGLGLSATSRFYAIRSLAEATAYLAHPLLGSRLREISSIVTTIKGLTVEEIFGSPDNMKLHSSMTLFAHAATENEAFTAVVRKYFHGRWDERTLRLLQAP